MHRIRSSPTAKPPECVLARHRGTRDLLWMRTISLTQLVAPAPADCSLHVNAVRPRRSCRERRVEIHVKAWIQFQVIFENVDHVYVVVAFKMKFAEVVLIEEVVGDHQSLVVVG